MNLQTDLARG